MAIRYRQLPLEEVTPGMVLSDDLLDRKGQVLLTQGMTLTESMVAALRRHQVTVVPIELSDDTPEVDEEAEAVRQEERLAKLFRKPASGEEDATGILQQYVRYFRLGPRS